jgi:hypothetical protein
MPKAILDFWDPQRRITLSGNDENGERVTHFQGTVDEMPEELRRTMLSNGTLFPTPAEARYIMGKLKGAFVVSAQICSCF